METKLVEVGVVAGDICRRVYRDENGGLFYYGVFFGCFIEIKDKGSVIYG